MPPDTPNPASAAARTGSGNDLCFGGEQFPGSAPAQKYQARILARRFRLRRDQARLLVGFAFHIDQGAIREYERRLGDAREELRLVCGWMNGRRNDRARHSTSSRRPMSAPAIVVPPLRLAAEIAAAAERRKP